MLYALYSLPDIVVIIAAAVMMVCIITFLPLVIQRVPVLAPDEQKTDFVLRLQTPLFTMCSLFLTFTLVEADNNYRKVDALISGEASQINRLDRMLFRYGDPITVEVRKGLRDYTRSIVEDDWPAMMAGGASEKTRQAFGPVTRGILALEPRAGRQTEIYAEMLRSFNAISEARDARLNAISIGLPIVYWDVVLFAVSMLMVVSSNIERTLFRRIILACQMAVLGAFIGFVFVTDQPFKGPNGVGTNDYVRTLKYMDGRT
jgi:hypothetical protein